MQPASIKMVARRNCKSFCWQTFPCPKIGAAGADAVIAVDLDYNQLATSGAGILFVAASGTAVTLKPARAI